jgi:hypothetical protein
MLLPPDFIEKLLVLQDVQVYFTNVNDGTIEI